jgi:hypothetical protein
VECVSQYYNIPDSERSDEEITMLRQVTFWAYNFLTHSLTLFSRTQSSYSHLLACRSQLIAQELYLMLPFFRILKFRNLSSAFYIHGKVWAWVACFLSFLVVVVGSLTEKYISFLILIHYFPPDVSLPYANMLVSGVDNTTFVKFFFIHCKSMSYVGKLG